MTNCSVTSIVLKITCQAFTVAPAAVRSPFVGFGAQPPASSPLTQPAAGSTASAAPAAATPLFSFACLAHVKPAGPSTGFSFGTAAAAPEAGGLFGAAPASAPAVPTATFSFGAVSTAPAALGLFCSAPGIVPAVPTMSFSLGNASLFGAVSAPASTPGTCGT